MLDKVKALLSKSAPAAAILQGLSKINPSFSAFIAASQVAGYGADQIVDLVRQKVTPAGKTVMNNQLSAKAQSGLARPDELGLVERNRQAEFPISMLKGAGQLGAGLYGAQQGAAPQQEPRQVPESLQQAAQTLPTQQQVSQGQDSLQSFLQQRIAKGNRPEQAAILAKASKQFDQEIAALEQQSGIPFVEIVKQQYGGQESGQRQTQMSSPTMEAMKFYFDEMKKLKGG